MNPIAALIFIFIVWVGIKWFRFWLIGCKSGSPILASIVLLLFLPPILLWMLAFFTGNGAEALGNLIYKKITNQYFWPGEEERLKETINVKGGVLLEIAVNGGKTIVITTYQQGEKVIKDIKNKHFLKALREWFITPQVVSDNLYKVYLEYLSHCVDNSDEKTRKELTKLVMWPGAWWGIPVTIYMIYWFPLLWPLKVFLYEEL